MIKKLTNKIGGGNVFLIFVILICLIIAIINVSSMVSALNIFFSIILKIIPVFILVFILMFILNIFLTSEGVLKYLGKTSGIKGWIISVLGGILSVGPIYMWYPLLKNLRDRGMKYSLISTFLYNRAIKLPLLPLMVFYFGVQFTFLLTLFMVIFSVFNGLIVGKLVEV